MRRQVLILVVTGFLIGFSGPVVASNTHTVAEWGHGLGSATDSDYYVHPYTHSNYSHAHTNNSVRLWWECSSGVWCDPGYGSSVSGTTSHQHISWDTYPRRECKFWTYVRVGSTSGTHPDNSSLNQHYHPHHNECTAVW